MHLIKKPAIHLLLIVLLEFWAYSGTFHAPFVLDDITSIAENTLVQDLNNFISGPAGYAAYPQRYIGYLSFTLNYRLSGLDVTGYHVINLIIHISNSLLVYLLVTLTFGTGPLKGSSFSSSSGWIALFATVLFAVHPVETQAVTYIVQRLTSFACLLYLCALIFYIKARSSYGHADTFSAKVAGNYLLSLVFAVLAMKTKEIAFTLPLIAALYEFLFFDGRMRMKLLFLLPMLCMMLVIPLSVLFAHGATGHLLSDINEITSVSKVIPRWDYMLTELSVVVTYIRLLFFPVNQNLDYDYPISHSLFEPRVLGSLLILLSIFGVAFSLFKRSAKNGDPVLRLVIFGILWFFITLSVESSFIPIQDVIFEHRVYIPSIGIIIAAASAFAMLSKRLFAAPEATAVAAVTVVLTLAVGAYARNSVWGSEVSLWEDVVRKSPNKARPHNNLGVAYEHIGMHDKAVEEYKTAFRINPGYADAHYNLGNTYAARGMHDKAVEEYKTTLLINPGYADAHCNLGNSYAASGMPDMAIDEYKTVLRIKPGYADAYFGLGKIYAANGMHDVAIENYKSALQLKPDYADIHYNLGNVYAANGMPDMAIDEYKAALQLKPDDVNLHYNLGVTLLRKGLAGEAIKELLMACRLSPDDPDIHNNLGIAYSEADMPYEAFEEFQCAMRLSTDSKRYQNNFEEAKARLITKDKN